LLLKTLNITSFRNYQKLDLDFDPRGAIITGENGSGKTNILEAVYFLAFGKSFRTAHDLELIRFHDDFFRINGCFFDKENEIYISAAADKNYKVFKINNAALQRLTELFGFFKTVYFSPADLEIVSGSPAVRRLFLDQAIAQYNPKYLEYLKNYRHILKQRNALLKSEFDSQEKKTWDDQFISAASMVYSLRFIYLDEFVPLLKEQYHTFISNCESVNLGYQFSFPHKNAEFCEEQFASQLKKYEFQEKMAQRTLLGPHLDDLNLFVNDLSARSFASQGQARSLVIIIRLVQALLISRNSCDLPLLMFDDVLSDLDQNRSKSILNLLQKDHQIIIATPFLSHYSQLDLPIIDIRDII
jgi:DNA replication and repair protein RecF